METLVHASDPNQAMREFYRVLKPEGVMVHVEYEHDIDKSKPAAYAALCKINLHSHMPVFQQSSLGTIRRNLESTGAEKIEVWDHSASVLPLIRLFYVLALIQSEQSTLLAFSLSIFPRGVDHYILTNETPHRQSEAVGAMLSLLSRPTTCLPPFPLLEP